METYRILCNERVLYRDLTQEEMFDIMDELSQQYYETGVPNPGDLMVECISSKEI